MVTDALAPSNPVKSLADRLTFPENSSDGKIDGTAEQSSVSEGQTGDVHREIGGSALREPEFDVEVKLSDMQADPNNPLHSVKSFEELGL